MSTVKKLLEVTKDTKVYLNGLILETCAAVDAGTYHQNGTLPLKDQRGGYVYVPEETPVFVI